MDAKIADRLRELIKYTLRYILFDLAIDATILNELV